MTLLLQKAIKNRKAWAKWPGFPTRKAEAFRYLSLKELEENSDLIPRSIHFDYEEIEPLIILPLERAQKIYGPFLEKRTSLLLRKEKDPFFLLNQAVGVEGLFIYVPPEVRCDQVLKITSSIPKGSIVHPRIEIFLGKGAHLSTIFETEGDQFWNNGNLNVTVAEGAKYTHYDIANRPYPNGWDFLSLQAEVKEKGALNYFSFAKGGRVQRRDFSISLSGKESKADLKGISLLKGKLEGHVHIRIDHQAPQTESNQLFKHALSERARSSFEGKIYVDQIAQKTQAYQLNNNLILGERAAAFSKPNLEIFADDVKASHGATISKPRLEELFYLRSRGLDEPRAKSHLVRGFCQAILEEIPLSPLALKLRQEIDDYLS